MAKKLKIDLENWDQLPTQKSFYSDVHSKILLFSAGLGSGKTHVLCRKMLKLSALNTNMPGGLLVPAHTDFVKDVKPEMEIILQDHMGLEKNVHWWFHETRKEYTFIWNRKPLYIFTGEKPIAGPNLAYCGVNEFSLIKWERVNEMLRRVRLKQANYPQKNLAGTPEDVFGWLEEFVERQEQINEDNPDSFRIMYADTSENYYIADDYRQDLEGLLDDQQLKVFASGQIVQIGSDYFYYAFDMANNVSTEIKEDPDLPVYVAMDFNVGYMCASFSHKYGQEQHYFDELLLTGDSDTYKMADAVLERFGAERVMIRCDASGKNRKTTGKPDVKVLQEKFGKERVRHTVSNPRLRDRQLFINGRLHKGLMKFNPRCKKSILDLRKVKQNKVDFSKVKDKEGKFTHFSDGIDYLEWMEHDGRPVRDVRSYQVR